ncbi:endoribonuclease L-PSP (pb5) [Trypanosoma cruzi]|uniref:Endoribonuclease L-PSP (Pb5) n=1 Tax=Trypanosoma cruzi TaxID=5693 RepID=A0A2V2UJB2_TRYCR|nr:endoribonuclease L-PSP (pb5) [Trypanosoma cruzi]
MSVVASGRVAANLQRLGIKLPAATAPATNYVPYVCSGMQLHVSGQLPKNDVGGCMTGQLGASLTVTEGQAAARACALQVVSQMQAALGDLDRVKRVVKLNVFVNSSTSFTEQSYVANGASELILSVFGEEVGRHARCAVGVAQLPFGAAVEVDALVELNN